MVGDHSKQYKATVSVLDMVTCYIMQPSGLYLTTFLLIHRDCTSNSTKDTEKLCYKNHLNALCCAELAELQDILKMCKLPFFLYSFYWKEVITVKCWGARGKQRLAGAGRNSLWTLMKNISTLFITKSTGHRWSKAHKPRYDGAPQRTVGAKDSIRICMCVFALFLSFILAVRKVVIRWQKSFCALRKLMIHSSYSQN